MAKTSYHVCYHCKDRHIGCHSSCEPYIQEKEELTKQRKAKTQDDLNTYTIRVNEKNRFYSNAKNKHKVYRTHKK